MVTARPARSRNDAPPLSIAAHGIDDAASMMKSTAEVFAMVRNAMMAERAPDDYAMLDWLYGHRA